MKNGLKEYIGDSQRRLIQYARRELLEAKTKPSRIIEAFMKGMLAGLKLAILEGRFVHNEIKRRERAGYHLVWLDDKEIEILDQYNP